MAQEPSNSIFSKRGDGNGGCSLSISDKSTTTSSSIKEERKNEFVMGNGRFNIREILNQIQTHGSADFEFGEEELQEETEDYVKPPKAFQRRFGQAHQDAYDIRDANVPQDVSIDVPSPEFHHYVRLATGYPVEASKLIPLTEDGGVRKRTLKKGSGPPDQVIDGCRVWIHYNTYLDNGSGKKLLLLDSTTDHEMAASLEIGKEGLPGLQLGLQTMRLGELAEFSYNPVYAYGDQGVLGFIGKNQHLRMIVDLRAIKRNHKKPLGLASQMEKQTMMEIKLDEVLAEVENLIQAGNAKFGKQLYRDACDRYIWALDLIRDHGKLSHEDKSQQESEIAVGHKAFQIYSNLALSQLRLENYEEVEKACEAALRIYHQPEDLKPKVIYRQALAKLKLGNFSEAKSACLIGLRSTTWGGAEFRDLKFRVESAWMRHDAAKNLEYEE